MHTRELDYDLPPDLVAQSPAEPRDAARLLVFDRVTGAIRHRRFRDLVEELRDDDLVVLNTTRVLPVRLRGTRPGGGAAEVLLLEPQTGGTWQALARPARRLRAGMRIHIGEGLEVEVVGRLEDGRVEVLPHADGPLEAALQRLGEAPLPPYIHDRPADPGRYQTVYAERAGSAAAPTAGLHFTDELLARVRSRCEVVAVDLQVGLDTFRPVAAEDLDDHPMHSEGYAVDPRTRSAIASATAAGRRVVAVGTTSVRVLETVADLAAPDAGRTTLKIQPGFHFRLTGALVTNFHLPRSTLLALVMAFAGIDETRRVYEEAIRERYRFYSFGDAMLIV